MFDAGLRSESDAAVVDAIAEGARTEAQAAARRIAAIGELVARRCADDERAHWACDAWDGAAAEVSAILNVTQGRASAEMMLAMALRHRLPRVAALFTAGTLSYRVCEAIVDRTYLVRDPEIIAVLDRTIADDAVTWGPLSKLKLQRAIDAWVDRYDPGALRRTQSRVRDRDIIIDLPNARDGVVEIRGEMTVTDAAITDRRLAVMAHEVCEDDPRSMGQRRSDALGAIGAGLDRLVCLCGNPECPAAGNDGRAASVVVHIVADADILDAPPDPAIHGETPASPAEPEPTKPVASGVLTGNRGIVPAPLLAELIRTGAKVRHVRRPGEEPEPNYRPSTALDEFVRLRDLTCRFPNCDMPAEFCDVDREHGEASLPVAV